MADKLRGPRFELTVNDELFPVPLTCIPNPPKRLYGIGDPYALTDGLAVIGARNATPYGRFAAQLFAGCAAQKGVCIISGGARGCDSYAHRAALEHGGKTVVFLGGGCDCIYPVQNKGLFQEIIDAGGAIVSENAWSFPPKPYTFRARNRLIAGLARAVLILEAGMPSGTFSTADEALAASKEVLVVPGSIMSSNSLGANRLLLEGAWPVVDEESFMHALISIFNLDLDVDFKVQLPVHIAQDEWISKVGKSGFVIYEALRANPMRLEELTEQCKDKLQALEGSHEPISSMNIMKLIGVLELEGKITRYPDGRFGAVS